MRFFSKRWMRALGSRRGDAWGHKSVIEEIGASSELFSVHSEMAFFPTAQLGSSLLLAFSSPPSSSTSPPTILLLSPNRISSLRAFVALEAGYHVVIGAATTDDWDPELAHRKDTNEITTIDWNLDAAATEEQWGDWLDQLPVTLRRNIRFIVLNDTVPAIDRISGGTNKRRSYASATGFKRASADRRYLVNIADAPLLSDFSWPVTHRFDLETKESTLARAKSPLQIAINTNSSACRLASRLRREIVSSLPQNIGSAVLAISTLRNSLASPSLDGTLKTGTITEEVEGADQIDEGAWPDSEPEGDEEGEEETLNKPVEQLSVLKGQELDRVGFGGRSRRAAGHKEEADRTLSPCGARQLSRSRSRARDDARSLYVLLFSAATRRLTAVLDRSSSSTLSQTSTSATSTASTAAETWTALEAQRTRMRYVAQISEYWPLDRLASVTLASISAPSTPVDSSPPSPSTLSIIPSQHSLLLEPPTSKKGRILLLGTGPGSPLLLTRLAYLFLTSTKGSPYYVDLFLSDKLVPSEILALIPEERRKGVIIARKFPGNAENAQDELMRLAVEGASEGKTVLRMKQGDPFLYGRGGEEVLHFRNAGFDPVVIPGLSSCLAGPTITGIPVTQRGVAESLVVCTGVGRGGRNVAVEGYERGKTLVVLMGVAVLPQLVEALLKHPKSVYPPYLPIALIERASSPDQRTISATISTLPSVLASLSAHRPPGMLVIGWGVMCLEGTDGKGDMKILDEDRGAEWDEAKVKGWLGTKGYRVKEGLGEGWRSVVEGSGL